MNVVIDSFDDISEQEIRALSAERKKVFLVEPFVSCHHIKGPYTGFPKPFPDFVKSLREKGILRLIPSERINAKTIYGQATDLAVQSVEAVYPEYQARYRNIFTCVQNVVRSPETDHAFKNSLCQQLAEFYALNIYLHRLQGLFPGEEILFYSDIDLRQYQVLYGMIGRARQKYFNHSDVSFDSGMDRRSRLTRLRFGVVMSIVILARALLGAVMDGLRMLSIRRIAPSPMGKEYLFGVTVPAPSRQLKSTYGRADFLIDEKIIKAKDVVYLPLVTLTKEQKKSLSKLPGSVHAVPVSKRFFSNGLAWLQLFLAGLSTRFPFNGGELKTASLVLSQYFLWQAVLKKIKLRKIVTHCDFGVFHIGRIIALRQAGVETWYFTDSMNLGCNLRNDEFPLAMRHPFWTYLTYDHFVTWNAFIQEFIQSHPTAIRNFHIVGCLWSQQSGAGSSEKLDIVIDKKYFVIGAFDSTYSLNGYADYKEAILFAKHLLDLVERDKNIFILLKEKKDRSIHQKLDPELGARLIEIYAAMDQHPRIKVVSRLADTGEIMEQVDMVISFPFTSTTYEALSRRVPAIWHDPLGYYKDTPYGKLGQVMTHGFEELFTKMQQVKSLSSEEFFAQLDLSSKLLDPFNDQKSIDRFRQLLARTAHDQ